MIRLVISAAILLAPAAVWLVGAWPETRAGLRRGVIAAMVICGVGWAFAFAEADDNTRDALPAYVIFLTGAAAAGLVFGVAKRSLRAQGAVSPSSRMPKTIALIIAGAGVVASIWLLRTS